MKPVRVRFAPSPTGHTHLASGRTALYNFLLARQTGGQFILRIEDTDKKRYMPGSEKELMRSLRWLGLDWDEGPDKGGPYGPYIQSERRAVYQQHAKQLIGKGHAYYCFCSPERLEKVRQEQRQINQTPRYDGVCRDLDPEEAGTRAARGEHHVIRFRMPRQGSITVHDRLRGDITVENDQLDDSVLVKSDGLALYHLAAMVDDHLMGITHVLRGSEWLSTFPLHVHILRAFGWEAPEFIHLSLLLKPSGKGKMSKRDTEVTMNDSHSIFIQELERLGYTPEAVLNWIALMGWSYDDVTEYFTLADLVEKFSLDHLSVSPAAINYSKLDHFNGLHIRSLAYEDLADRARPFLEGAGYRVDKEKLEQIIPLIRERLVTLDDAVHFGGFFFKEEITPNPEELIGKNLTAKESADVARQSLQVLEGLPEITAKTTEPPLRAMVNELKLSAGQVFGILRVALTGQTVSPPLFECMEVLGKKTVLERVRRAIEYLERG